MAILSILRNKIKTPISISLFIYFIASILLFSDLDEFCIEYFFNPTKVFKAKISEFGNILFAVTEIIFFYTFFNHLYQKNRKFNVFLWGLSGFIALAILYIASLIWTTYDIMKIIKYSVYLNIIEFMILFLMCLYFFYTFLNKPITEKPFDILTIWIISSLFIYISTNLPFLIISEKIRKSNYSLYDWMFTSHYMTLLFVFSSIQFTLIKKKEILI